MRNIHVTPEPVTLEGFQAVLKPSKFGYSLKAVVGEDLISKLETERDECLKWAESKLKNPKRSTLKPTPWEEVSDGKYLIKFSWSDEKRPPVVDTEGTQSRTLIHQYIQAVKLNLDLLKSHIY